MPIRTSDKTQGVKIRMGEGRAATEPITQVKLFDDVVAKYGDKPALHQKIVTLVSLLFDINRNDDISRIFLTVSLRRVLLLKIRLGQLGLGQNTVRT